VSSWKALLQARRQVRAPMKRNGVVTYSGDPVEGPRIAQLFESELAGTSRTLSGPIPAREMEQAHAVFAKRLGELKADGIDVDLVIVPVHIWRLELFRSIGVEAQSASWKRRLAATIEALAAGPGSGKLRLFDFARPHPFTEQSIFAPPPQGERRFYLESSHFYPWLGDKVLAKVFGKEDEGDRPVFGQEIRDATDGAVPIDIDIASAKADLDGWEAAHPEDVDYVKKLISKR
jgi:hypothetical protein